MSYEHRNKEDQLMVGGTEGVSIGRNHWNCKACGRQCSHLVQWKETSWNLWMNLVRLPSNADRQPNLTILCKQVKPLAVGFWHQSSHIIFNLLSVLPVWCTGIMAVQNLRDWSIPQLIQIETHFTRISPCLTLPGRPETRGKMV